MAGPKGNSEFCFSETSMFPEAKPRGTLRLEGKQNSLFAEGPVIECFVIPPNSKMLTTVGEFIWQNHRGLFQSKVTSSLVAIQTPSHRGDNWKKVYLPRFQGARAHRVRVESSSCCFPRELVSFDPRHVTRFPPMNEWITLFKWCRKASKIKMKTNDSKLLWEGYKLNNW